MVHTNGQLPTPTVFASSRTRLHRATANRSLVSSRSAAGCRTLANADARKRRRSVFCETSCARRVTTTGRTSSVFAQTNDTALLRRKPTPSRSDGRRSASSAPQASSRPTCFRFGARSPSTSDCAAQWEGNCDGCYLKRLASKVRIAEDYPDRWAWWVAQEADAAVRLGERSTGARFRLDHPNTATIARMASQRRLPIFDPDDNDTIPCACTD